MNSLQLAHEIEILPTELQKQVFDFVAFLKKQQLKQRADKRSVGEYCQKIRSADDFDEPLGDDFWLGQS